MALTRFARKVRKVVTRDYKEEVNSLANNHDRRDNAENGQRAAERTNVTMVYQIPLDRWLSPEERTTLRICENGRAVRSNYTADHPELSGWRVHWHSLDVCVRYGLIMKVGKYYQLTEAGWRRLYPQGDDQWR